MAEDPKKELNVEIDTVMRDEKDPDEVQEFIEELNPEMARNGELEDNSFPGYEDKNGKTC